MSLKEIRKKLGYSQDEVAKNLGVHLTTYGKWELEQTEPDISNLIKLSKLFKVSIDQLIGTDTETINLLSLGETESYLIRKILKMNQLELAKTKAYVMGLTE